MKERERAEPDRHSHYVDVNCYPDGCPSGFSSAAREYRCTGAIIQRSLSKISGPLLDRIDLRVEVPTVPYKELRGKDQGTGSTEMRQRARAARSIQQRRGFCNARIPSPQLRKLCALDEAGERYARNGGQPHGIKRPRTTAFSRSPAPWPKRSSTGAWTATTEVEVAR